MNEVIYIQDIFKDFVMPGVLGGFIIAFGGYFLSLGISLAYKLISNN